MLLYTSNVFTSGWNFEGINLFLDLGPSILCLDTGCIVFSWTSGGEDHQLEWKKHQCFIKSQQGITFSNHSKVFQSSLCIQSSCATTQGNCIDMSSHSCFVSCLKPNQKLMRVSWVFSSKSSTEKAFPRGSPVIANTRIGVVCSPWGQWESKSPGPQPGSLSLSSNIVST